MTEPSHPVIPLTTLLLSVILLLLLPCVDQARAQSDASVCRQKDKDCKVLYEWVTMDYLWPNQTMKDEYVAKGLYDPKHCLLSGVKVHKNEVFVTIPRIRYYTGVPSPLNKVVIDPDDGKPKLEPFPSWEVQQLGDNCDNIQMGMSIEIDPVSGYLYIIDPGRPGVVGDPGKGVKPPHKCPPKLVVFDINDGSKVRSHELPPSVASKETNFLNDIVLDRGDSTFVRWVYITDALDSKLYVMDLSTNETRALYHSSMDYEEAESKILVNGANFTLKLPIDGLAMTPDFKYVYYCALGSRKLWRVPTFVLRDPKYTNISDHVVLVGNKISQTGGMIYAENSLYYGGLSKNSIYKWDVVGDMEKQGVDEGGVEISTEIQLVGDDEKLVWPDAFAIDESRHLYVTSGRANLFLRGGMDFDGGEGPNFRIWKINIGEHGYLSPDANDSSNGGQDPSSYGFIGYITLLITLPLSTVIHYVGNFGNS